MRVQNTAANAPAKQGKPPVGYPDRWDRAPCQSCAFTVQEGRFGKLVDVIHMTDGRTTSIILQGLQPIEQSLLSEPTVASLNCKGKVYLVGAGPGDPGLITLRGVEYLRRADVVLYDYLVNPRILDHAQKNAKISCLGRHGQGRIWKQEEINQKLVELAQQGLTVVRLKGGDPAVFARGAEELEFLASHDIPYEVVPGITAALAAGSCAGIPITHRDLASTVALVTGQLQQNEQGKSAQHDYAALANFPGTLVFYMGATTAEQWTQALMNAGKAPDTPAALIRRCSLPDQLTIRCSLGEIATQIEQHRLRPPLIVILGPAVTLQPTLSWFEKRPLFGKTVMVTRSSEQAGELERELAEQGANVLLQPAINIEPPTNPEDMDDAIEKLSSFDWLVFSSANGVRTLLERIDELGYDLRLLGNLRLATIGPGTTRELSKYKLRTDLQPDQFRAEALAQELMARVAGKRILLARASRGREVLAQQLKTTATEVRQVVVYNSIDVTTAEPTVQHELQSGNVDWTTVSSSAIAKSLVNLFGDELRKTQLVSISPITTQTLRELGHDVAAEASSYTMSGMVAAMLETEC